MNDWEAELTAEWEIKEGKFLNDIAVCKILLDTLLEGYTIHGYKSIDINSSKVARTRMIINDILKKY